MTRYRLGGPTRARVLAVALVGALLLLLAAPSVSASPPSQAQHERAFSVMTRNLYLGASLAPLFPQTPLTPTEVFEEATGVWHQVAFTDYPTRAGALADEIAATTPDIIGLQEVTRYEVRPLFDPTAPFALRMDFLDILQAELAARGQLYRVAVSQEAFSGELPALDWDAQSPVYVRLTDRDVILVRTGPETANMSISNAQSGLFSAKLQLPIGGEMLDIERGWNSVDVKLRGRTFRVINTHLEAFFQPVALAQAQELLGGPAATSLPVVMLGDFNSAPGEDAYNLMTQQFSDAWPNGPHTCCYDASLADPASELGSRIDLVLHRGAFSVRSIHTVGVAPFQDTAPRWASDHVGVVAELIIR